MLYLLIFIFGCAGLRCCAPAVSSCGEGELLSSCRARASYRAGFPCGAWALEHRLCSCHAQAWLPQGMWDLPGPGIETVTPAFGRQILNLWTTRGVQELGLDEAMRVELPGWN